MATVFLGLGSNIGNRHENLERALKLLAYEVAICAVSSIYETEPVGYLDQPWFLNAVCKVETDLSPREMLALTNRIEWELGRRRIVKFGPRIIDIDILLYDALIIDEPDLRIPHPEMTRRAFVLIPLAEIGGSVVHPITGMNISDLRDQLNEPSVVHLWQECRACTK